ncbi:hypothetical protein AVEN_7682-1 [Araneus ventricosus]|uniref:Uncharacterized protein n=1 Tax=Araneus ventricosus TaxID=182803 RepID=A0A4Y2UH99_ARAVE|nr:hypothetical protein AVEN_7682-1 [Araneus ventricosus]
MSLSRAVSIINRNCRKRENRSNEIVEESFLRRSNRNEQNRAKRFGESEVSRLQEHGCGTLTGLCFFCLARFGEREVNSSGKYTKCCHDKKIILPEILNPPEILKDLLTSDSFE